MQNSTEKKEVVILGAGLAGLACGHELTKKSDQQITIVEKYPYVGGLAVTMRKNGFSFDSGPHRWFTKSEEVDKWLQDLMRDELVWVNRLTRIYYKGKYYFYPLKTLNALRNLGLFNSTWAILSYAWVRIQLKLNMRKKEVVHMADAYINQFGYKLYEEFFHYYTEKLWGRKITELSGDWVSQRSKGLSIWGAVKDSIIKQKNIISLIDRFKYPKRGFGRIAEKMEEEILQKHPHAFIYSQTVAKVNWRTDSDGQKLVASVELEPTPATEVHDRDIEISGKTLTDNQQVESTSPQTIPTQQLVSSIPITELVQKLNPLPPEDVIAAAKGLSYRDEVHVVVMVNKSHFTPDNWVYTQDQKLIFVRLMEMDSWTDGLSPAGTTSLVFEVACQEGDAIWTMEDQKLVDMVAENYINEFHYFEKSDILDSYVHRVPKEYPVYDLGYKEKIAKIKDYLKEFSNLQCIGRNGTFKYNNSDHSIQMGLYAARNILGDNYDLENVNTDRAYQEIKKEA